MGIVVNSPHSGRPVKVRDQDVGRAVKDEEGRIFYVLPKSDGSGHYGALTRAGGERDEQRAAEMDQRSGESKSSGAEATAQQLHDARGKRRKNRMLLIVIVVLALLAVAVWALVWGPLAGEGEALLDQAQTTLDEAGQTLESAGDDEAAPETPDTP